MLPDISSKLRTLFINSVDTIISSNTGTEPPTMLVLPPCGQTANLFSLQNAKICETSSEVFGFNTKLLKPQNLKFQIWNVWRGGFWGNRLYLFLLYFTYLLGGSSNQRCIFPNRRGPLTFYFRLRDFERNWCALHLKYYSCLFGFHSYSGKGKIISMNIACCLLVNFVIDYISCYIYRVVLFPRLNQNSHISVKI